MAPDQYGAPTPMPKLDLTPAEGLLVAMNRAECEELDRQVEALRGEIRAKQAMVLRLIFESHGEPAPSTVIKVLEDQKGKPIGLEWDK